MQGSYFLNTLGLLYIFGDDPPVKAYLLITTILSQGGPQLRISYRLCSHGHRPGGQGTGPGEDGRTVNNLQVGKDIFRIDNKITIKKIIENFRFACRIICSRDETSQSTKIFAAGFDSSRNIFLGEKATKWETEMHEVDGLTTNGVLIMHPQTSFCGADDPGKVTVEPGVWREVSVGTWGGNIGPKMGHSLIFVL